MPIDAKLKTWAAYVEEAHLASRDWRSDSWTDMEMYDGKQWTDEDEKNAIAAGIDPITINRTFPTVNLILGSQVNNRYDITAKARTSKDSEMSQTMSESIKFVMDQNNGEAHVATAFRHQAIAGLGYVFVGQNRDPRKEIISVKDRDWKEIFSDPYADPWADAESCRYMFHQRWVDLDVLQSAYPDKKSELENMYGTLTETSRETYSYYGDQAEEVEDMRQAAAGVPWADNKRRRVRPVEIWYTKPEQVTFAVFDDGRVIEITDSMHTMEQYQLIRHAQEVVTATVKRMYTGTFVSRVVLQDETRSPFAHDQYPFVPFVGYLDRFGFPYGIPRQIRGQDIEVNKRRSMALAMLKSRRILAEDGIADTKEAMDNIHKEANKLDGVVIVKNGSLTGGRIKIEENAHRLEPQVGMGQQAEKEIQEVSGVNGETSGYKTNVTSGIALQEKQQQSATVTAPLFDNLRRSKKQLGELIVSNIQSTWTRPKILRVTDRLTGADKFLEINKRTDQGVKCNVTEGRYDTVVSEAPRSSTVRERNINLIIEWVKKSPPEVIPHLMGVAFEMSDLPNKEQFLEKIKPLLGQDPLEEDMSAEDRKAKLLQELQAQQQQQAQQAELEQEGINLELNKKRLENAKIEAEIAKIKSDIQVKTADAEIKADDHHMKQSDFVMDSTKKSMKLGEQIVHGQTSPEMEEA